MLLATIISRALMVISNKNADETAARQQAEENFRPCQTQIYADTNELHEKPNNPLG